MSPDTPQWLWRYNQRPTAGGWEAESLGTAAVFPQVSNLEVRAAKRRCEGEAGTPAFQQEGNNPCKSQFGEFSRRAILSGANPCSFSLMEKVCINEKSLLLDICN